MVNRWIDIETAKKVLQKTCKFLESDNSGIADFKISNGKEAIILSLYSEAFFILNEKCKFKFRPVADAFHPREPLTLIPTEKETWAPSEIISILALPLSSYFKFFPDLNKPKYLFMIDATNYAKRKYDYSGKPYYEDRIIDDVLEKARANNINPTDCLIWISNPDGTYGEDFWEYVSGIVLRDKGYFITRYTLGGGDLSAYYIPDYRTKLIKEGFITNGAFIEELEMIGIPTKTTSAIGATRTDYESIVIEAESSDSRTRQHSGKNGVGQVINYLLDWKVGYTNAFVSGPFTAPEDIHCGNEKCMCKFVGLISCKDNGELVFSEPSKKYREQEQLDEKKIEIIKKVIKNSLLRNLSYEERCELIGTSPINLAEYFEKILTLDIEVIISKLKEKLKI